LFGPAYKGITLAAAVAIAYGDLYKKDIPFAYNRKETKDHGEGGVLVGAQMEGKKVLIIDDVITAGTAITEAMKILKLAKAKVSGVVISLDRQEKASILDTRSAIEKIEETFQIPVLSIANLDHLVLFLEKNKEFENFLPIIKKYRTDYGVIQNTTVDK
jgi:orotate phosphoribosyltransferase